MKKLRFTLIAFAFGLAACGTSAETERKLAELEQEVSRAKQTLRDQVADLAVAGAEKILAREINPQVHAELLNKLKAEL